MKTQSLSIGVDIGTGGCKTTIVNAKGTVVTSTFQEYDTNCPEPRWSEQEPDDWYAAFITTVREALKKGRVQSNDIASICIDGQIHTLVLLDEKDEIIRPAIVWTDQRSGEQSRELNKTYGDLIFKIGNNSPNPTWTISMLAWVRQYEPDNWSRISKLMLPKDYIRYKITGEWATDWTDAAGTLMMEMVKKQWSDELCDIISFPKKALPQILPPTETSGKITKTASADTGIPAGTPVVTGSSDVAAEVFGTGLFKKDQLAIKLATAGVVFMTTEKLSPHTKVLTYPHVVPSLWFSAAGTNSCASSVRWLRDVFGGEEMAVSQSLEVSPYEILDAEAGKAPAGSDGLIYHPYLLGERSPYWDPDLKGSFTGIRMSHQKKHFVRSVLEGVSFSIKDCFTSVKSIMSETATRESSLKRAILLGGGSKSRFWSQILSDVLGIELHRLESVDASFGAALIGGVGVSMFESTGEAIKRCVRISDTITPNPETSILYQNRFNVYQKIHDALSEIYRES